MELTPSAYRNESACLGSTDLDLSLGNDDSSEFDESPLKEVPPAGDDSESESDEDQAWDAMRGRIKAKFIFDPSCRAPLPRMCDHALLLSLDDKVMFAQRMSHSGLHPPTVIGEDFASWTAALDAAEAAFGDVDLWFLKHRRSGGQRNVSCVHGRAGAESLVRRDHLLLQNYVLQANVPSTLLRGWKCSIRCYGAFFQGRAYYLEDEVLVKVHAEYYSENSTDPAIHSMCLASRPGVTSLSGEEFFAELPRVAASGKAQAKKEHPRERELHEAAREVLRLYKDEALLVPLGQYCVVGLDFLLPNNGGAVCLEANVPCTIFDLVGSKSEGIKLRMRQNLKALLEGSHHSKFEPV